MEKLTLNTSYYFLNMCVEEEEFVKKGANLLKYTNGTYFSAKVTFENNGNLKIGMSASCEIIIEKAENVVAVPLEAVQTSYGGKYVIVVNDDGSTSEVSVETGISNDAYIQIKSGISEGTTVQMIESSTSSQTSGVMGFEKSSFRGGMSESSNFNGGVAPTEMKPNMP